MGIRYPLFFDWLTQTININNDEHYDVKFKLDEMLEAGIILAPASNFSDLTKSYKFAYRIPFGHDCFCIIQISPHKPGHRFMRIDWNPAAALRVCANPFQRIEWCLRECIPSYSFDEHIWKAKITRLDLSFDLRRVAIDSFLIHTTLRKFVSGRYFYHREEFGPTGRLNEIHIGRPDGDKFLKIYDKKLEQKYHKEKTHTCGVNHSPTAFRGERIQVANTRFELRLGNSNVGSFDRIRDLENPFSAFTLTSLENRGHVSLDHVWHFFTDSCKLRGAQGALSLIQNQRERKRYADALKIGEPDWWDADEIWSEFPDAFNEIFGSPEISYVDDWFATAPLPDADSVINARPRQPPDMRA